MTGKRASRYLWVVVALSLTTCESADTHTGPSEGIIFYENPNYDGSSRTFQGNFNDLDDVRGPCGEVLAH